MKFTKLIFAVFAIALFFSSCEKEQKEFINQLEGQIEEQAETISPVAEEGFKLLPAYSEDDPHLFYLEMYKSLKEIDSQTSFSADFIEKIGTPLWKETLIFDGKADLLFSVTPVVDPTNEEVTGIFYAHRIDGVNYFEVVQKEVLYSSIQNMESEKPEATVGELLNSLIFTDHFSNSLYEHYNPKFEEMNYPAASGRGIAHPLILKKA